MFSLQSINGNYFLGLLDLNQFWWVLIKRNQWYVLSLSQLMIFICKKAFWLDICTTCNHWRNRQTRNIEYLDWSLNFFGYGITTQLHIWMGWNCLHSLYSTKRLVLPIEDDHFSLLPALLSDSWSQYSLGVVEYNSMIENFCNY